MSSCRLSPSLESITSSGLSPSDEGFNLNSVTLDHIVHTERPTISELVDDAPDRVQMNVAREEWARFQAWEQQCNALETTSPAPPVIEKHERFFLPAENIFFLVSNTLYSVPRAPFEWHSSSITGKGLSGDDPLILEDITVSHFDNFLSILFPYAYGVYTASTVEEWTAILHLANEWRFESIRTLAITHLFPIATDVEKIILGRQYAIDEWLGEAYLAICSREQWLSKEEGMRMKKEDIIEISAIRHQKFGQGVQPNNAPPLLIADVCARFGLVAPCASVESDSISHADVDGGLGGSNLALLAHSTGTAAPAEEAVLVALNSEASLKEAAEIKSAQKAREKELTNRALESYLSSTYQQLPGSLWHREMAVEAMKEVQREEYKNNVHDFIATYISENSESTSP
ncbi:hypothetical protein FIBSPDRAFT_1052292 [Athelia psychrophila]|uniref:BTB domain-containing protein n=1 Tax=Athelia psychrophila TaxID=1759441 RepID=A0A165XK75_9AGAM|nr:hypothetical protein FIBSPDRAFT_1052292 [Fibularhizoctonia sp. CBS 109695]